MSDNTIEVPSLSIIIVNWNSEDYVRSCLLSIEKYGEGLASEIIVVDGGSFDGCGDMLESEFPDVKFIQSPENVGFARSNNLGFKHATSDAVLLLNPDTELKAESLKELLIHLASLPQAGILGPVLLNTDGSLQTSSVQALPRPLNQLLDANFLKRLFPKANIWKTYQAYKATEPCEVEAVSGACMLLHSKTFNEIGRFTTDYFMYAEDMDLCRKVRESGLKNYHIPNVKITHHGGGSSSTRPSEFSTVMKCKALQTYMRINHGTGTAALYRLFMFTSGSSRIASLSFCWLIAPSKIKSKCANSLRKWLYITKWALGHSKV